MNNEVKNFINDIILEASLDARISDGVVNFKNYDHIKVLAEIMYDKCQDEAFVNEFIGTFLDEGKYPDRQAFNKEGWLVTFPSKEYRDAAIKKGTHAISDPTHGKGGMNLYYKRKGKQKRQTQQVTTKTEPEKQVAIPSQGKASTPQKTEKGMDMSKLSPDVQQAFKKATGEKDATPEQKPTAAPKAIEPTAAPEKVVTKPDVSAPTSPDTQPTPAEAPAIDVPVVTTPPEEYVSISKKFAAKKGWMSEPYGEYRDAEGNTVAVVGLSGEVVPVRNNDREEYKLFAEKSKA